MVWRGLKALQRPQIFFIERERELLVLKKRICFSLPGEQRRVVVEVEKVGGER